MNQQTKDQGTAGIEVSTSQSELIAALEVSSTTDMSYSPLCLSYNGRNSLRRWSLRFQRHPSSKIVLDGDEPTRDEIIECLMQLQAPIWMIGVCEVAIGVATRL